MSFIDDWDFECFYEREDYFTSSPQCRRCGVACYWQHTGARWLLADKNGGRHQCSEKRLHKRIADDFDVLPDERKP